MSFIERISFIQVNVVSKFMAFEVPILFDVVNFFMLFLSRCPLWDFYCLFMSMSFVLILSLFEFYRFDVPVISLLFVVYQFIVIFFWWFLK